MSEDDLIEASPCKLRNGDWGCKTQEPVQVGDAVQIVTRANKQWRAEITQVVWTDGQVCICATASDKQKKAPDDAKQPPRKATPERTPKAAASPRNATADPAVDDAPPAPPRAARAAGVCASKGRERGSFDRPDHHDHLAPFHLGHVFDLAQFPDIFGHTFQQFAAQVLVRHFPTAESQCDFHFIAVFQKLVHVAHLDVIVMGVGVGAELHLLHLDHLLLLARLGFPLLLFVLELAVIHDLAHGRRGVGRNLDKVEPGLFGKFHATGGGYNADIFAVRADKADFGGPDPVVDAGAGVAGGRRVMGSAGYGDDPFGCSYGFFETGK